MLTVSLKFYKIHACITYSSKYDHLPLFYIKYFIYIEIYINLSWNVTFEKLIIIGVSKLKVET
jgi:hypothetical protein